MYRWIYSDEQLEKYLNNFMDWYERSPILNNTRREVIEEFLPVVIGAFELGMFANRDAIMSIREIVNGLPA